MIEGFVYILSNKNKTVLYVGATKFFKRQNIKTRSRKSNCFYKKNIV